MGCSESNVARIDHPRFDKELAGYQQDVFHPSRPGDGQVMDDAVPPFYGGFFHF